MDLGYDSPVKRAGPASFEGFLILHFQNEVKFRSDKYGENVSFIMCLCKYLVTERTIVTCENHQFSWVFKDHHKPEEMTRLRS